MPTSTRPDPNPSEPSPRSTPVPSPGRDEPVPAFPPPPLEIRVCTILSFATGLRAQNLREFRRGLQEAPISCIYHHFWGRFLRPQFDEPDYNNDFASWTQRSLNEKALAEQLSAVNPAEHANFEVVRQELVDLVDARLDRSEAVPWAHPDDEFHFIEGHLVVFPAGRRAGDPRELGGLVGSLSAGSIFYHFIDARRRTAERRDDFSLWIDRFGDPWKPLSQALQRIDPYFSTLTDVRQAIHEISASVMREMTP